MSAPVLEAWNISKRFGSEYAVRGVSLTVEAGTAVCILGPSGSGKTTFIRCLNHLEEPDEGYVFIEGEPLGFTRRGDVFQQVSRRELPRQRRKLGMVFQQFNLFDHMTALENVTEAPCKVLRRPKAEAHAAGMALLERVGLADRAHHYPRELSGGQQQRVAIARALAMEPRLLLCDEPTSALDPEMVHEVLQVLGSLVAEGMTMVTVTHEVGFAREVAERFVFMEGGVVVEEGDARNLTTTGVTEERTRSFLAKVL
ncbi:MAG: ectoine/hydroxyectoine transporter ATP-binding protein EhuA [Acidimicrobiaceae bacterium]|nr:ectoine/hydroxyectoine transporter ATP-binding protein EhuA [Acidimicrobiaceae bacterium]